MEATLLTLGVLLILVGLIGQVKAKEIEVGTKNTPVRIILGLIGFLFVYVALSKSVPLPLVSMPSPTAPVPKATSTPAAILVTGPTLASAASAASATAALLPTTSATATPAANQKSPAITNFQTCADLCSGQNRATSFAEKITKIYAQFNYENFPAGAAYERTWSLNGMQWIRYRCNWDGPSAGTEILTLKEPKGLHSGTWVITVTLNGALLLKDQLTVDGNWNDWAPAGTVDACHGTVD